MPPCLIKNCKVIIPLRFFPTGAGDFMLGGIFFRFRFCHPLLTVSGIFFLLIVIGHVT